VIAAFDPHAWRLEERSERAGGSPNPADPFRDGKQLAEARQALEDIRKIREGQGEMVD
jgi:hypothetical protein